MEVGASVRTEQSEEARNRESFVAVPYGFKIYIVAVPT